MTQDSNRPAPDALERSILEALSPFPEIELLILFGSAAQGQARPDSDLDLAVATQGALSSGQKRAYIESLSLALARPIDLIDLRSAPAPLIASILSTGSVLLKRNPDTYAKILRRHWSWNEDMGANHQRFLAERRAKAFYR